MPLPSVLSSRQKYQLALLALDIPLKQADWILILCLELTVSSPHRYLQSLEEEEEYEKKIHLVLNKLHAALLHFSLHFTPFQFLLGWMLVQICLKKFTLILHLLRSHQHQDVHQINLGSLFYLLTVQTAQKVQLLLQVQI